MGSTLIIIVYNEYRFIDQIKNLDELAHDKYHGIKIKEAIEGSFLEKKGEF